MEKHTKISMRKSVKKVLSSLTESQRCEKSLKVLGQLESLIFGGELSKIKSSVLGVFAPLHDEVDWLQSERLKTLKTAFPYWTESPIEIKGFSQVEFHKLSAEIRFDREALMPDGSNGSKDLNFLNSSQMPALLVPGLAFTGEGRRLGRGKGFYDRYLENYDGIKIGLCFYEQIMETLPFDEHDQKMDYVVTEDKVFAAK
ncbi:MAG: 5-formyltetrahydrofolate cyclo-ligase [Bacteriovoracaceae bacterium]